MNKARAMLDALMGPGRDQIEKDKNSAKEKFKDKTVCKGFLIGMCPRDASMLGAKRSFAVCEKIHSEIMRDQLKNHPDCENLTRDYEALSLQDLEFVIRECEGHIATERQRIRTDVRRKKPPLPPAVNDRLSAMKRESSAMIQKAEQMDDDQIREKEALITKANELLKEREEMLESETKKAAESLEPEEVCDICGTAYIGSDGDAAHLKFRIHEAYKMIRDRVAELKPRVEEWDKKRREKKDEELKKKRKEEWDKALEKEKGSGEKKNGKARKDSRERSADGDKSKKRDKDADKDKEPEKRQKSRAASAAGAEPREPRKTASRRRDTSRSPSGKKSTKPSRSSKLGRSKDRRARSPSAGSRSRSRGRRRSRR